MKKNYVFYLFTFFSLLSLSSWGQTTIYTQDFETLNSGYTASTTEGTPGSFIDIFNRSNPNIGGNSTFIWAVEDTGATPASITLDQIDISGYSDFTFSIDLLAHHYLDWDSTDEMNITYSIDGGAPQNLLSVQSTVAGDDFNTPAALDTDFDGEGDCSVGNILPALTTGSEGGCTVSNNQFATFSSSTISLAGNSTLDITISFEGLTAADEGIYLDDIEVVGTSATSDTQVQFDSASTSVNEDAGTVSIGLSILNEDASNATSVEVALTSGNATDIDNYTTQTITFPAGSAANQTLTVDITDNATDEADKNLTFTLQNVSGGNNAQIGAQNTFDLTIVDDDLPAPITLPYTEDFSNCATAEWITFDEAGTTNSWTCGSGEYQMNGFSGSGDDIDWLVSDFRINFDDYSSVDIDVLTQERFGDAINQAGEFRLAYSTDYDGLGDPTTGTWTDLTFSPNNTSTGSTLSAASTVTVDASSVSGTAFIAFIYDQAQGLGAEDWRVQQVDITGVPATSNSADSDIAVTTFDPTDNIDYTLYSANSSLTTANAIKVGEFTIRDGGATNSDSDSQSTTLTDVTIDITNFDNLAAIALFDGASNVSEITSVTASNAFTSLTLEAVDDGNKTFDIYATFDSSVVDNAQLQFTISSATADIAGSLFTDVDAGGAVTSITGDDNKIEVTATDLLFNQDATDVGVGNVMTPSPTVEAYDTNLNLDLDFTGNVALSPTGTTFDGAATTTVAAVAGVATFSNLVFDATATGATLEASSGALTTDTSSAFDVIIAPIVIAQEDFDGSTPSWPNDISDQTFVDPTTSDEGLFIQPSTNIGTGNTAFGRDTEGESGEPTLGSTFTFTFEEVAVTNFSSITLEFDYYVFANAEVGSYQLVIDGTPQTAVEFYNDPDTTPAQGTITENIGTASTVGLIISGTLNGGSDIMEYDNFRLEGNYDGDLVYSGGTWSPSAPSGTTGADDVLVQDGTYTTSSNITVNSISVLGDASVNISSSDVLTVNTGIYNNGSFTFNSDASGSAQLADATGVTITGDITTERFIPKRSDDARAFRFLASPVENVNIADAWQLDTHITGAGGASNGFDATTTNNPSMFTFDHTLANQTGSGASAAWIAVTSTTQDIVAGRPYRLYVRGDRSVSLSDNDAAANDVTLSATGTLHTGNHQVTTSDYVENYTFIGNPYQAVVDLNNLTYGAAVNTNNAYYWDPSLGTAGGFVTIALPSGVPNPSSSNADEFLRPGQAVFMQNNSTGSDFSIEFNEDDKATSGSQTQVFSVGENLPAFVNMRIYKTDKLNNGFTEEDAFGLRFTENGNNAIDALDASKMGNPGINIASVNSNKLFSIENRAIPQTGENIPFLLNNLSTESYTFAFNIQNFEATDELFLKDNYTGELIPIQHGESQIEFTADASIQESIDILRFELVFGNISLSNDEFTLENQIQIFPNPVNDVMNISLANSVTEKNISIEIYDVLGKEALQVNANFNENNNYKVDTKSLNSGVYFVKIGLGTKNHVIKFIKL